LTGAIVCWPHHYVHEVSTKQRNGMYFVVEMTAGY